MSRKVHLKGGFYFETATFFGSLCKSVFPFLLNVLSRYIRLAYANAINIQILFPADSIILLNTLLH